MKFFGCCFLLAYFLGGNLVFTPEYPGAAGASPMGIQGNEKSRGVVQKKPGASPGYVLFSPLLSTKTYLIDYNGKVVNVWESEFAPGVSVYLLDDGYLLRCARQPGAPVFSGGGAGGRLQKFDWDGRLVWDFVLASKDRLQHHDVEPLANGNVLVIAWEHKTREQALRAGRHPNLVGSSGLWPDCVLEIAPHGPNGGRVVWEWHLWDHLIQDLDPKQNNWGNVSEHPELVDINGDREAKPITDEQLKRLKALGYVSGDVTTPTDLDPDFVHTNSIAYNPRLDQIALCAFSFNEIWLIDHSTSTKETAGHAGGRSGKGGDLLFRWGNPRAYGRGGFEHQRLFAQHDARWVPEGYPGAGNILVFNNGGGRPDGDYSSVIEIRPPLDSEGRYEINPGGPFGPDEHVWEYTAANKESFFADFISGAQRFSNGNTFICAGPEGRFFEVTPGGETVWEYYNPYSGDAPNPAGDPPYSVFRATHLPPDHPALVTGDLRPLDPQPPYVERRSSRR